MSSFKENNKKVIAEFRANDGKVGGGYAGMNLLLLHTTGRKSGQEHITPLVCMEDGDRLVIIASKGGAPEHPHWYRNLAVDPNVTIEYGSECFSACAAVAEEPERTRLYDKLAARHEFFARYRKETAGIRTIPVVILTRKGASKSDDSC
ncbi:MAG: nitroreductase family deazaflavin-dependent oxidoreductase [Caldilineaceae bacterium]|nr:nitroreductase family deazaflavin-dependent oxidoreductase [Caldilineaceae bacterium]